MNFRVKYILLQATVQWQWLIIQQAELKENMCPTLRYTAMWRSLLKVMMIS